MTQVLAGLVVLGLLGGLVLTKRPPPLIFSAAMVACYIFGLVSTDTLLAKASNEGLITLVLLLLVSVGLERLPWLGTVSQRLVGPSLPISLLRLTGVTALFSGFVNNTAVVATLAGAVRRNRYHRPSKLLLPLSYSAILGGTLTLIGTSTNLIVSGFLQDATGQGIRFFAFLPVAAPAAIAGICAIIVLRHWLPERGRAQVHIDEYLIEAEVLPSSKMIGKTIQGNGLRDLGDLFLVEVVRGSELLSPVAPTQRLEAGDRLIFSGDITRVGTLDRFHGLKLFAVEEGLLSTNMTEVVIMPNAAVAGQTIKQTSFRAKFDAAVVGLKRDGERLSGKLGSIALRPGDSLMLAVGPDFQYRGNLRKNFLVVDDSIDSASLPLFPSLFVSGTLIAVVISAAAGLLPLIKGLAFLLAGMLALGVVSGGDLRRRFPFEMWLIISSALVVSQALNDSGLIEGFITTAAPLLAGISPLWALVAVYLLTLVLTELMTNNAAAAMVFPLAYSLALSTGADPMAFVMAVAFGASASFVTPFGYTTNLMVQNLGGYRRLDYLRMGAPVSVVYSAVVLSLLTVAFPLTP